MEGRDNNFFVELIKKKLGWRILLIAGFFLYFLTLAIVTDNTILSIIFCLIGGIGIWGVEWGLKEAERVLPLVNDGTCHWFKIITISALLIFGALIFFLSPKQERFIKSFIVFNPKTDCAELAQYYIKQKKEVSSEGDEIDGSLLNILNERYVYSPSLDTCLVYFEVTELGVGITYNVVDVLNGSTVYKHLRYQSEHQSLQELWDASCRKEYDGCIIDGLEFKDLVKSLF